MSRTDEQGAVIHVGWTGQVLGMDGLPIPNSALSETIHKTPIREMLLRQSYVPVFLDDQVASGHYEGYCKSGAKNSFLLA
jgi:hypothetical protein